MKRITNQQQTRLEKLFSTVTANETTLCNEKTRTNQRQNLWNWNAAKNEEPVKESNLGDNMWQDEQDQSTCTAANGKPTWGEIKGTSQQQHQTRSQMRWMEPVNLEQIRNQSIVTSRIWRWQQMRNQMQGNERNHSNEEPKCYEILLQTIIILVHFLWTMAKPLLCRHRAC